MLASGGISCESVGASGSAYCSLRDPWQEGSQPVGNWCHQQHIACLEGALLLLAATGIAAAFELAGEVTAVVVAADVAAVYGDAVARSSEIAVG